MTTDTRMTADEICQQLDRDSCVYVTRGGERFYVGEDEDCNGYYAWRVPGDASDLAVASFGECDYPGDLLTTPPDYRALSERIAEWLAEPAR